MKRNYPSLLILSMTLIATLADIRAESGHATGHPDSEHADSEATGIFQHDLLDTILKDRVDAAGGVDYSGLRKDRGALDLYIRQLAACSPRNCADRFSGTNEQLAYWINAYNAFVLLAVVDAWPIRSVADVEGGLEGFFRQQRFLVGGDSLALNDIENRIIRPEFRDPRIHFAVNCGAASCPALDRHAYKPTDLDSHLDRQTRRFAADSAHVRVEAGHLYLSRILDWYGDDFVQWFPQKSARVSKSAPTLLDYVSLYAPADLAQQLTDVESGSIKFSEYDWRLNAQVPETIPETTRITRQHLDRAGTYIKKGLCASSSATVVAGP
jgi:hypothetical protein